MEKIDGVILAFQATNLVTLIGILVSALYVGHVWPRARPYLIAPITLAVHGTLFYIVVLFHLLPLTSQERELWSAVVRFHSHIIFISMILFYIFIDLLPRPKDIDFANLIESQINGLEHEQEETFID